MSSISLMGIAFDRFKAVAYTSPPKTGNKMSAIRNILLINLTSIIMIFPYAFNMKVLAILDFGAFMGANASGSAMMASRVVVKIGKEALGSALEL